MIDSENWKSPHFSGPFNSREQAIEAASGLTPQEPGYDLYDSFWIDYTALDVEDFIYEANPKSGKYFVLAVDYLNKPIAIHEVDVALRFYHRQTFATGEVSDA